jgi:K+-sensing histidine kinase KdpD
MQHQTAALARTAGLKDFRTPCLEDVDRRRSQLWLLSLIVGLAIPALIIVLGLEGVSGWSDELFDVRTVRLVLLALLVAVFGYIAEREATLRRLTRLLVDERILTASLVSRVEELDALLEASRAMNSSLELTGVLDVILTSACELLGAEAGSIQLLDPESGDLVVTAVHGTSSALPGQRQAVGEGLAGGAAANREPLLISGPHADSRNTVGVATALVVPLVNREDLVGVLNLSGRTDGGEFNEFQLRSVAVFGETAAAAVANAHAHARTQERIEALTELDRLKTEFLAMVTHELRTPLTSLIGMVATLSHNAAKLAPDQIRHLADTSLTQGWRLERLVGDLLQSAEAQNGTLRLHPETLDLGEVLTGVVDGLRATAPGHVLRLALPREPARRHIDGDAVNRIVTNLVGNAVKYTPVGTAITVALEATGGGAVLTVTDQGPGIPASERAEMFSKFRRGSMVTHTSGLGLGLYIVRSLAEAHGGVAELREAPGGGCEFVITLAELPGGSPVVVGRAGSTPARATH